MTNLIKKEDLKSILDSDDIMSIVQYSSDLSEKIKENSQNTMQLIESSFNSSNNDIVSHLDKALQKVDANELEVLSNNYTGVKKLINTITRKKDKIMTKYTSISNQLDEIYVKFKSWENALNNNDVAMKTMKTNYIGIYGELDNRINIAYDVLEELNQIENKTDADYEKIDLLNQKIVGLQIQKKSIDTQLNNIDIARKTNYNIYKRLHSVYDSTLPVIQMNIAMDTVTSGHKKMIENINILDQRQNDIMINSANSLIKAGKESMQLMDMSNSLETQEMVRKTIEQGVKEIDKIRENEINKMKELLNEMKDGE